MKKTILAMAAVATIAVGALAIPNQADARCRGCGIGLGVIGGLAAGAIIGSAIANSGPAYAEPVYDEPPPPPVYYREPDYVDGPVCHVVKRRIYVDGVGWRWSREEICD